MYSAESLCNCLCSCVEGWKDDSKDVNFYVCMLCWFYFHDTMALFLIIELTVKALRRFTSSQWANPSVVSIPLKSIILGLKCHCFKCYVCAGLLVVCLVKINQCLCVWGDRSLSILFWQTLKTTLILWESHSTTLIKQIFRGKKTLKNKSGMTCATFWVNYQCEAGTLR